MESFYSNYSTRKKTLYERRRKSIYPNPLSLGILLDNRLPHIGGPKVGRRLILAIEVASILLFEALWAKALYGTMSLWRKLAAPYRLSALQVTSGLRSVSYDEALILAGMIPVDILEPKKTVPNNPKTQRSLSDVSKELGGLIVNLVFRQNVARSITQAHRDSFVRMKELQAEWQAIWLRKHRLQKK